jgi:hypothetical protein
MDLSEAYSAREVGLGNSLVLLFRGPVSVAVLLLDISEIRQSPDSLDKFRIAAMRSKSIGLFRSASSLRPGTDSEVVSG